MKADARVLVVAPNWLGDAVMALPALGDLRDAIPTGELTIAARGSIGQVFSLVTGVDAVVTLSAGRTSYQPNIDTISRGRFDVAILFPNSFASAWMTYKARVPERWGYRADWRSRWLTRPVPRPAGGHQVAYYRDLVRALGVPPAREPLSIVVSPAQSDAARQHLESVGWNGTQRLIGIAPGAAYGKAKQWPPEYYAGLIADLQARDDARVVLVGTDADAAVGAHIAHSTLSVINLIGRTDIPSLAAVLTLCDAFVSNDSGAMHLAVALGVPVTALFGPTNERETAPRPRSGGPPPRVITHDVFCRPCMLRECPIDHRCMRGIDPLAVAEACRASMAS